jgi:protein phosphatase
MKPYHKLYSIKGKSIKSNSDYILVKPLVDGWIGIVCDGVGASEISGKLCAEKIIELLERNSEPDPLIKVKLAIEETNKYLLEVKEKSSNNTKVATTLVVLYLINHTVCWGHVGDSRIYQLKNGRLNLLTKDHSVIQELVDGGFLTLKEAALHSGTNIIGKAMGEKQNVTADVSKMHLQPTDRHRFLLCTDGLTSIISDNEIEKCLQKNEIEDCYNSFISSIDKSNLIDDTSFLIVDPF